MELLQTNKAFFRKLKFSKNHQKIKKMIKPIKSVCSAK